MPLRYARRPRVTRFRRRVATYRRRRVGGRPRRTVRRMPMLKRPSLVCSTRRHLAAGDLTETRVATSNNFATIQLGNGGLLTLHCPAIAGEFWFTLAMAFRLDDIPGKGEFAAMWEEYKFTGVTATLQSLPTVVNSQAPGAGEAFLGGWVHMITDKDDIEVIPASVAGLRSMREYSSYKSGRLFSTMSRTIIPAQSVLVYAGETDARKSVRPGWISTETSSADHYGMKFLFQVVNPSATATNVNFKLELAYAVDLRYQK